jgi:hypothetical protein
MYTLRVRGRRAALAIVAMALLGSPVQVVRAAEEARLTDRELRTLALAHAVIEQKATQVYPRVEASADPARDLTGADRRAVEDALRGSGVPFDEFARVQRRLRAHPDALPRFFEIERQVKAGLHERPSGPPKP